MKVSEDIEPERGIQSSVFVTYLALIFTAGDIEPPMAAVLQAPVAPDKRGDAI